MDCSRMETDPPETYPESSPALNLLLANIRTVRDSNEGVRRQLEELESQIENINRLLEQVPRESFDSLNERKTRHSNDPASNMQDTGSFSSNFSSSYSNTQSFGEVVSELWARLQILEESLRQYAPDTNSVETGCSWSQTVHQYTRPVLPLPNLGMNIPRSYSSANNTKVHQGISNHSSDSTYLSDAHAARHPDQQPYQSQNQYRQNNPQFYTGKHQDMAMAAVMPSIQSFESLNQYRQQHSSMPTIPPTVPTHSNTLNYDLPHPPNLFTSQHLSACTGPGQTQSSSTNTFSQQLQPQMYNLPLKYTESSKCRPTEAPHNYYAATCSNSHSSGLDSQGQRCQAQQAADTCDQIRGPTMQGVGDGAGEATGRSEMLSAHMSDLDSEDENNGFVR